MIIKSLRMVLSLVLAGSVVGVLAEEKIPERFLIEPESYYCLTFELESPPAAGSEVRWVLQTFNREDEQPFDGVLEGDWQKLVPGQTIYRHAFLSTEDAAEVRLGFQNVKSAPPLKSAVMEKVAVENVVLNGDFSLGTGNQSGWNQMHWAAIIGEGGTNLLQVNQNGYALTDYFLVEGGGAYDFMRGAKTYPSVRLLAYDQQRRLIGPASINRKKKPSIRMPEAAAYARILYETWHDHIPAMRINRVPFAGLVRHGDAPVPARSSVRLPRADEEIVLAPQSDPREVYAARELQHWMAQITGRLPPLLAAPSRRENVKIYVGTRLGQVFTDDLAWLGSSDGYAVRRKGDAIYVFGTKPRGTLFGVFALLERNSDIIWPRPNPAFEAFWTPQTKLAFKDTDFRSRPAFAMRNISHGVNGYRFQEWMARNGLNSGIRLHKGLDYLFWERGAPTSYGGSHLGWISGTAKKADPTFYPLIDGTRSTSRWRQPCYTHPDAASEIAASIRRALALIPDQPVEYISSIISDNWSVCACDRCMQPIRLPDGTVLKPKSPYSGKDSLFFSTRNFMMLNAVAEDLAKDFPDLRIITHAYIFAAEPPLVKLHPMIIPQFAAYPTQNARFPIRSGKGKALGSYTAGIWKRRFEAWGKWYPAGLGYFGYYYTQGFNALADTAAADFKDLADMGGVQAHTEGYPVDGEALTTWDVDGAEKWIIARLMWDPSQDPAELRKTYVRKVFREAAPQVQAFFDLISRSWHDPKNDLFVNCHSSAESLYEGLLEKPGFVAEARALLVQGVAAAKNPQSRQLVQRMLDQLDGYRTRLGRRDIPFVEESREEWGNVTSTHWEKALVVGKFKKVDDWRFFGNALADQQTEVSFMHDGTRLYVRFIAYDDDTQSIEVLPKSSEPTASNGDCIEMTLVGAKGRKQYLSVAPNGNYYASPKWSAPWEVETVIQPDGWVTLMSLPFSALGIDAENPVLKARVGRVYRRSGDERQESTPSGSSLYNTHASFLMHLTIEGKE